MNTRRFDIALALFSLLALSSLCACDMDMNHETYISPHRMQVTQDQFFAQVPVESVNESYIETVAMNYDRKGSGPVDLTITYDPESKTNTAMKAGGRASVISKALRQNGIENLNVAIMPVHAQGGVSNALISFDAYEAKGPKDCTVMAGMETTNAEPDPNYKLGCTMGAVMADQIARPKDLARSAAEKPTTDGRRAGKIIEIYRGASKDQKLEGESASGH